MKFEAKNLSLSCFLDSELNDLGQYHVSEEGEKHERFEFFARVYSKSDKLICLLPSALPVGNAKPAAVFHRWSWSAHIEANVIAINDPTFSIDGVYCGWFLGDGTQDLFEKYSANVIAVADKLGVVHSNIFFYGSSMGGFSALMMAGLIPGACAIAEVPQLNLLDYPIKSAISTLENSCLNGNSIGDFYSKFPQRISVLDRFKKTKLVPELTIITNSADTEFNAVFDFAKSLSNLEDVVSRGSVNVLIHPDPIGHAPLHTAVAIRYLKAILDGARNVISNTLVSSVSTGLGCDENSLIKGRGYKEVLDEAVELSKKIRFIRTPEDKELYEETVRKLRLAGELNKSADWPYLKICSIEKLWSNSFNKTILDAAETAFRRRQTLEAFIYCCRGYLYNFDNIEAVRLVDSIVERTLDKDVANVGNIFKAILSYDRGDYFSYAELINSFRAAKTLSFEPYIAIPVSTVYTGSDFLSRDCFAKDLSVCGKIFSVVDMDVSSKKYIISISCDQKYFSIYGEYLLKSFTKCCSDEAVLHISFLDGDAEFYQDKIDEWGAQSVFYSIANVDTTANKGPISSLLRFSVVSQFLEEKNLPVLILDLDTVIKKSFVDLLDLMSSLGVDIISRVLEKGVAPWEKYTGGFALFNNTASSKLVAKNIAHISSLVSDSEVSQWWIDQNVFEAGIRSARINSIDLVIHNIFNARDDYCVMPVGSQESKLFVLNNAMSSFV